MLDSPSFEDRPFGCPLDGPGGLTAERLRQLLSYDPSTGIFRWKIANGPRAVVGAVAGTIHRRKRYRSIRIDNIKHAAHRLAWLYVHGTWPHDQIDHRNRVRDDNRIDNLRQADNSTNRANGLSHRTGALKGAYRAKRANGPDRWSAIISVNHQRINLGLFSTEEEAHLAYKRAAIEHFGEFARWAA